jgi:hypothetical protein
VENGKVLRACSGFVVQVIAVLISLFSSIGATVTTFPEQYT